jgi:uncharacterized protein YyaL (SSP411 family)
VYETFEWLIREMTGRSGEFYSALDADSEGEEGKYYVWTNAEMENILGDDAKIISSYYGVTPEGNWEHGNNILKKSGKDETFLKNLTPLQTAGWPTVLKRRSKNCFNTVKKSKARTRRQNNYMECHDRIGLTDTYRLRRQPLPGCRD